MSEQQAENELRPGPDVTLTEGGIHVDFSGFFNRELDDWCFFSMNRKRNFAKMSDRCAEAMATLLLDPQFTYGLLWLRNGIALPEEDPNHIDEEQFTSAVVNLFNDNVIELIGRVVDTAYDEAEVDIDTEHTGRNNEELQFTNVHARTILRWSFSTLAVAPIITTFMDRRGISSKDSTGLIIKVFCALLHKFEPADRSLDILAKVNKLVESRVLQTRYSDKVMWNYLRNVATDPHIFINRLFRRFIAESVPKLLQGSNVIKFFHTFLKNQIKYQFLVKFPISYRPMRAESSDPDGMSVAESIGSELIRRDESVSVIGRLTCAQAIRDAAREVGGEPTEQEVEHWSILLREYGINTWQRSIVTKFFLPRIGRVEYIHSLSTLRDYTRMLLITRRWLQQNDFPALYDYMSARISSGIDTKKLLARRKFIREFIDSDAYRELLGGCFPTTSQSIVDSSVIIEMISSVHAGNFERMPETPEELANGARQPVLTHRVETVAQEVLRFIAHISRM